MKRPACLVSDSRCRKGRPRGRPFTGGGNVSIPLFGRERQDFPRLGKALNGRAHAGTSLELNAAMAHCQFGPTKRLQYHGLIQPTEMADAEHLAGNLAEPTTK